MAKKKRLLMIPVILLVLAAFLFFYPRLGKQGESSRLLISGNIEATLVKVSFKIPGRILKRWVDEGDRVRERALIAKLEDRELIDQKNRAEASLETAQQRMASLLLTIEKEEKTSADEIQQAEAGLRAAEIRLTQLLNGSRPQEVEQARAEVEQAKAELEKAEKFMERSKYLFERKVVSAQDWDTNRTAYEVAAARYRTAQERYGLVKEGPRKEEIEQAMAEVERAKASLSLAHSKRLQVKVFRQDLETQKALIKEARASLEVAIRQLEYSEVFAPVPGVVLVKSAEEGEYVSAGATVVTIADLDHPWLKAYLDETDLGRVKLGQEVRIRTDTFPNKTYTGKISFISSEAEFTPKQVQTQKERVKLVYRIKVDVDNPKGELKPGMPADGEIFLSESKP
jgi:HlyD family secretion protein